MVIHDPSNCREDCEYEAFSIGLEFGVMYRGLLEAADEVKEGIILEPYWLLQRMKDNDPGVQASLERSYDFMDQPLGSGSSFHRSQDNLQRAMDVRTNS